MTLGSPITLGGRLPTGRPGQVLAVALLAAMLAAAWAAVAAPLLDWYGERAERLDQRQLLARRMAQVAAQLPDLQAQATTNANSGPAAIAVLPGASDAVSGAELQQRLQELAAQAGTTLVSTEAMPAQQQGAYRLVGVRIAVNAPWPVLVHLLQTIEAASPQMLIDDLQIHGNQGFIRDGSAPLPASLAVTGFRAGAAR